MTAESIKPVQITAKLIAESIKPIKITPKVTTESVKHTEFLGTVGVRSKLTSCFSTVEYVDGYQSWVLPICCELTVDSNLNSLIEREQQIAS